MTQISAPNNQLTSIAAFPKNLTKLICNDNLLTSLPPFANMLTELYCYQNLLTSLPALPNGFQKLICYGNALTSLPNLPSSTASLSCSDNQISALPALPGSLTSLSCSNNPLTAGLPVLPNSLTTLVCNHDSLSNLPSLPAGLTYLSCYNNQLTSLPALPNNLGTLNCLNNQITGLPILPGSLSLLWCRNNQLSSLPSLPGSLQDLDCSDNQIDSLPVLPSRLKKLNCYLNNLSSLPALPDSLVVLGCTDNQITSIPTLPDSLYECHLSRNPLSCLPQLKRIVTLYFASTSITCLPNYGSVTTSFPALNSLPLCDLFNNNGCAVYWNINGKTYYDENNNCQKDIGDVVQGNVKLQLWSGGILQQQTFTGGEGLYSFDVSSLGNYEVRVDTAGIPFNVSCPVNNLLYDTLTAIDSLDYDKDFALECKAGFDLGALSICSSRFRPASFTTVVTKAGDLSNFYGVHCANGVSGSVTITIAGPASYVSPMVGALTPSSVSGGTVTYNIADFGTTNFSTDFNTIVQTDTTALPGSLVCITVSVSPTTGDNNPANNTRTHCFTVFNSFDPNSKEVYPIGDVDINGDRWLTYTINFQNTGNDTAIHIYITDTLDTDLDESTFQLLAYSVQPMVQITGNAVRFNFPNIYLPDSNVNEAASHGYVQYKVKLKDNLAIGTQIDNTAFIYFDFNAPVVTNTVTNIISCSAVITQFNSQICEGETYAFAGMLLDSTGIYVDSLLDVNGCDSILELTLTVLSNSSTSINEIICDNETYNFYGLSLNTTGVYFETLQNGNGCDSVIELTLSVLSVPITAIGDGVCENETYNFNGTLLTDAGLYYDTLSSMNGCDSIVALTLYTFSSSFTSLTQNTCAGDTFYFGNSAIVNAGVYTDTLQNAQGCDSVIQLALIVLPVYSFWIDTAIVQGSTFTLPSGNVVSTPGIYSDTLMTGEGCDSVIVVSLSVVTSTLPTNSLKGEPLRIYPNPASNSITISIDEGLLGSNALLTDCIGRKVASLELATLVSTLDIGYLAKGVYLIAIMNRSGSKAVKKLVIE